jgi:aminoglycoside phosphotransferase (APT) family kinase protein
MHTHNILIRDGHVVGILDWEMAGWYPEYWEWCKALWAEKSWEMEGWCTSLKEFLQPYNYEYAVHPTFLCRVLRIFSLTGVPQVVDTVKRYSYLLGQTELLGFRGHQSTCPYRPQGY